MLAKGPRQVCGAGAARAVDARRHTCSIESTPGCLC